MSGTSARAQTHSVRGTRPNQYDLIGLKQRKLSIAMIITHFIHFFERAIAKLSSNWDHSHDENNNYEKKAEAHTWITISRAKRCLKCQFAVNYATSLSSSSFTCNNQRKHNHYFTLSVGGLRSPFSAPQKQTHTHTHINNML